MKYTEKADFLGIHILAEVFKADSDILNDAQELEKIMLRVVEISGATFINSHFHQFSPQGVTGVIIVAESHFSIHTWPEHNYAAVDIFTCSSKIQYSSALDFLKKELTSDDIQIKEIKRGFL